MTKPTDNFIIGRLKSIKYAAKGGWLLITTEHSIILQSIIGILITLFGFFMHLSSIEWMFQTIAIGLVIISEATNTAVEYLCDYIHPKHDENIGLIKDIAAGIPFIAAIFAVIIGLIIYVPKFI
ncbi:MAG: diacylglycerol kinase family protein [Flavobacteriaceae bacterium]|nr:diacylglycerol kinase family protein [Flavobacteriaceae bacterium]